jgi:hypothetical protein
MKIGRLVLAAVFAFSVAAVFEDGASGATDKRVNGIITAVGGGTMTVAPIQGKQCVTGKLDATTRIVVDGRAAKPGDLHVTETAKAELGLNDTWLSVVVVTR